MNQLQALLDFEAIHGRKMTQDEIKTLAESYPPDDPKRGELLAIVEEREGSR